MGRWTQYDEDEYRLPAGTKRVAYDADTQQYTFQSGNQVWQGEPGTKYGVTPAPAGTAPGQPDDEDELEGAYPPGGRGGGYQPLAPDQGVSPVHPNRSAYRMLLPFLLLVGVFLLVVWRFLLGPTSNDVESHKCHAANPIYRVKKDDTCWKIAQAHRTSVIALQNQTLNPGLECDRLRPGDTICLPLPE